jgi:hypothetical protein
MQITGLSLESNFILYFKEWIRGFHDLLREMPSSFLF